MVTSGDDTLQLWAYRRPEYRWGIVCLPEFWLTLIFGPAFIWSLVRDRRDLPRKDPLPKDDTGTHA